MSLLTCVEAGLADFGSAGAANDPVTGSPAAIAILVATLHFLVEWRTGKADPNKGGYIATVLSALTDNGVVVDFQNALLFVLFACQFDNGPSPRFWFRLRMAVFAKAGLSQYCSRLIAFRAGH
jgi:hypothetical protein